MERASASPPQSRTALSAAPAPQGHCYAAERDDHEGQRRVWAPRIHHPTPAATLFSRLLDLGFSLGFARRSPREPQGGHRAQDDLLGFDLRAALAREIVGDPGLAQTHHLARTLAPAPALGLLAVDGLDVRLEEVETGLEPDVRRRFYFGVRHTLRTLGQIDTALHRVRSADLEVVAERALVVAEVQTGQDVLVALLQRLNVRNLRALFLPGLLGFFLLLGLLAF